MRFTSLLVGKTEEYGTKILGEETLVFCSVFIASYFTSNG